MYEFHLRLTWLIYETPAIDTCNRVLLRIFLVHYKSTLTKFNGFKVGSKEALIRRIIFLKNSQ